MKYGDTLQQRSIPEWGNYNVDYNDLKRLIKVRTTRGQGEALTIPGHENEARALQAFENEFFAELVDQHQRVDLFVQSKAGEIHRRLIHLDRQVGQLQQRFPSYHTQKVSVRCLERFAKAEDTAEKAGEEIRSLARFVGAQKLAFIKLLKKYRKWTSSLALESRFQAKVLNQPTAFARRDFQPLLTLYNNVLAAVRAPFECDNKVPNQQRNGNYQPSLKNTTAPELNGVAKQRTIISDNASGDIPQSTAASIQAVCQNSSDMVFDTALAVLPLGRLGGKASYWVHPDNLVELHVLLLQYTRLRRHLNPDKSDSGADLSRCQSRRTSRSGTGNCLVNAGDEDVGLVICDDLQKFASRQSSAPISDTEEAAGGVLEKAAAAVRYPLDGEAIVAINTSSKNIRDSKFWGPFRRLGIKKKTVRHLFDPRQSTSARDRLINEQGSAYDEENLDLIQDWLKDHQEIQPLVQLQCKRTRFIGLKHDQSSGTWATLDRDIIMKKTPRGFFNTKEGDLGFDEMEDHGSVSFPFAVLEVRYEGNPKTDLLAALDETHLTERIRGFSIETHAVTTLYKPPGLPPPYWLPALDQDLRKIPATVKTARSRQPNNQLSPSGSVGKTSISATSVGDGQRSSDFSIPTIESSATSVPNLSEPLPAKAAKKKRRLRKDRPLRQQVAKRRQSSKQHYWNEYDDGGENTDNEPFVIYVNPDKSTSFPGFPTIYGVASSMASRAKSSSKKVQSWLRRSHQSSKDNRASAGDENPYFQDVATLEDDSDLDDSPTDPLLYHNRKHRQYSTFAGRHEIDYAYRARESLLSRCCAAFFVASFVLLIVAVLLASAGRRKAMFKVDVGIITGVVFSLLFAISGVGCMVKRQGSIGIAQRALVFMALVVVCVASGILLAGVVGA